MSSNNNFQQENSDLSPENLKIIYELIKERSINNNNNEDEKKNMIMNELNVYKHLFVNQYAPQQYSQTIDNIRHYLCEQKIIKSNLSDLNILALSYIDNMQYNFEENNKERKDIKDEIENIKNKIQNIKENYVELIKNQDDYYINSEFKKHTINDLSFPHNIYELYCFNRILNESIETLEKTYKEIELINRNSFVSDNDKEKWIDNQIKNEKQFKEIIKDNYIYFYEHGERVSDQSDQLIKPFLSVLFSDVIELEYKKQIIKILQEEFLFNEEKTVETLKSLNKKKTVEPLESLNKKCEGIKDEIITLFHKIMNNNNEEEVVNLFLRMYNCKKNYNNYYHSALHCVLKFSFKNKNNKYINKGYSYIKNKSVEFIIESILKLKKLEIAFLESMRNESSISNEMRTKYSYLYEKYNNDNLKRESLIFNKRLELIDYESFSDNQKRFIEDIELKIKEINDVREKVSDILLWPENNNLINNNLKIDFNKRFAYNYFSLNIGHIYDCDLLKYEFSGMNNNDFQDKKNNFLKKFKGNIDSLKELKECYELQSLKKLYIDNLRKNHIDNLKKQFIDNLDKEYDISSNLKDYEYKLKKYTDNLNKKYNISPDLNNYKDKLYIIQGIIGIIIILVIFCLILKVFSGKNKVQINEI